MYALLIAAWRRMLTAWGRGLDPWSAARIWTVSSLGKYLPGKVWAVAGMAVMAQRAGIGAGPATGSAVILQVLAIGTGAAVVGLTGWGALRAAYPGRGHAGWLVLLAASVAGVGLLLWPALVNRVLRLAAPDAGPVTPPVGSGGVRDRGQRGRLGGLRRGRSGCWRADSCPTPGSASCRRSPSSPRRTWPGFSPCSRRVGSACGKEYSF